MTRRRWVAGAALITVKALRGIQVGDEIKMQFEPTRRGALGDELSDFYAGTWATVDEILDSGTASDLRVTFKRNCPHKIDTLANLDRFEWGVDYDEIVAWRPKKVKP